LEVTGRIGLVDVVVGQRAVTIHARVVNVPQDDPVVSLRLEVSAGTPAMEFPVDLVRASVQPVHQGVQAAVLRVDLGVPSAVMQQAEPAVAVLTAVQRSNASWRSASMPFTLHPPPRVVDVQVGPPEGACMPIHYRLDHALPASLEAAVVRDGTPGSIHMGRGGDGWRNLAGPGSLSWDYTADVPMGTVPASGVVDLALRARVHGVVGPETRITAPVHRHRVVVPAVDVVGAVAGVTTADLLPDVPGDEVLVLEGDPGQVSIYNVVSGATGPTLEFWQALVPSTPGTLRDVGAQDVDGDGQLEVVVALSDSSDHAVVEAWDFDASWTSTQHVVRRTAQVGTRVALTFLHQDLAPGVDVAVVAGPMGAEVMGFTREPFTVRPVGLLESGTYQAVWMVAVDLDNAPPDDLWIINEMPDSFLVRVSVQDEFGGFGVGILRILERRPGEELTGAVGADLDADGRVDGVVLTTAAPDGAARILVWQLLAPLDVHAQVFDHTGGLLGFAPGAELTEGRFTSVAMADVNHDGVGDLVLGAPSHLRVVLGPLVVPGPAGLEVNQQATGFLVDVAATSVATAFLEGQEGPGIVAVGMAAGTTSTVATAVHVPPVTRCDAALDAPAPREAPGTATGLAWETLAPHRLILVQQDGTDCVLVAMPWSAVGDSQEVARFEGETCRSVDVGPAGDLAVLTEMGTVYSVAPAGNGLYGAPERRGEDGDATNVVFTDVAQGPPQDLVAGRTRLGSAADHMLLTPETFGRVTVATGNLTPGASLDVLAFSTGTELCFYDGDMCAVVRESEWPRWPPSCRSLGGPPVAVAITDVLCPGDGQNEVAVAWTTPEGLMVGVIAPRAGCGATPESMTFSDWEEERSVFLDTTLVPRGLYSLDAEGAGSALALLLADDTSAAVVLLGQDLAPTDTVLLPHSVRAGTPAGHRGQPRQALVLLDADGSTLTSLALAPGPRLAHTRSWAAFTDGLPHAELAAEAAGGRLVWTDLDGDRVADLAASLSPGCTGIRLGLDGVAGFGDDAASSTTVCLAPGVLVVGITAAKVDAQADSGQALLSLGSDGTLSVTHVTSQSGMLQAATATLALLDAPALTPASLATGDVDGDGVVDVVVGYLAPQDPGAPGGTVQVFRGAVEDEAWALSPWGSPLPSPWSPRVALGDVDGDGWMDLVVTGWPVVAGEPSPVQAWSQASGAWVPVPITGGLEGAGLEVTALTVADVDADGDQEALLAGNAADGALAVVVIGDDGAGTTLVSRVMPVEGVHAPVVEVRVADMDGNGLGDVVALLADGTVLVAHQWADGLREVETWVTGQGPVSLAVGWATHVNGAVARVDGKPDVLVANRVGQQLTGLWAR
jgi:hypothetical protein